MKTFFQCQILNGKAQFFREIYCLHPVCLLLCVKWLLSLKYIYIQISYLYYLHGSLLLTLYDNTVSLIV